MNFRDLGQFQFVHPIMKPEKSDSPLTENSIFRMFTGIKRLNFKTLKKDMTSPFQIRFQKLYSIDKYQHWIHPPSDELFTICLIMSNIQSKDFAGHRNERRATLKNPLPYNCVSFNIYRIYDVTLNVNKLFWVKIYTEFN